MKVLCAIIAISLIPLSSADILKFVAVLYRHGDRAPAYIYPTDPNPATLWPNGLGQLTNAGKNRTYELGKYIRKRYPDLLPSNYHPEDFKVQSSDVDRVIVSGAYVAAGLYEPEGHDVWSDSIKWQPIPIHSIPQSLDYLLLNNVSCPKHQLLLVENVFIPKAGLLAKYKKITKDLCKKAGCPPPSGINPTTSLLLALNIYDCMFVEEKYGYELPEWSNEFYPEPTREIAKFVYTMTCLDKPLKRLFCGPLLKVIIQHLDDVAQGVSKIKMVHYAGHDASVVGLLQCLGVYDGEMVPFAAAVFFELYETDTKEYKVAVNYKKDDEVQELIIPGCEARCELGLLKKLTADVIPDNWEEECKL